MRYPDLRNEEMLAIDTETHDPLLRQSGNGVYRKDGRILGVSIATKSGFAEYYPLGHDDVPKEEQQKNWRFVKEVLALPMPKLGANLLYDLDWLVNRYDVTIGGEFHDVQFAEPLIDAYGHFSLDHLANKYLGVKKQNEAIEEYARAKGWKGDARQHLAKMPFKLVYDYGKSDAAQTFGVFEEQKKLLVKDGLIPVYEMERKLIPLYLKMRRIGVCIDVPKLYKNVDYLRTTIEKNTKSLYQKYGEFNFNSSAQLAKIVEKLGLEIETTDKGNPSVTNEFLQFSNNEDLLAVYGVRRMDKMVSFLENSILGNVVNGRIHAQFNALRSDDYGAVTGRMSSSNPNLQQVKHVDKEEETDLGFLTRDLFIPEEGQLWGSTDLSQIEYRFMAHFAIGRGAEEVRQQYINDPKTDFHQVIMDLTQLERYEAKRLNFGVGYFMGAAKMAKKNNWSLDKAKDLLQLYHARAPFIRATAYDVIRVAKSRDYHHEGYVRTIMGRKARISDEMRKWEKEYALYNYLIQGSAADAFKKALLDNWEAGVYDVLTPHLFVHDETDVSVPDTKEGQEAYAEQKYHMENAIKLKVPIIAKAEIGPTWAQQRDFEV